MLQRDEQMLSVKEAARVAGVHQNTIHNWIKEGTLPAYRVGVGRGRLRLKPSEVWQAVHTRWLPWDTTNDR